MAETKEEVSEFKKFMHKAGQAVKTCGYVAAGVALSDYVNYKCEQFDDINAKIQGERQQNLDEQSLQMQREIDELAAVADSKFQAEVDSECCL